ncbi:MAG: site-specific DNA-methyltransferase [Prevotella sp.]|jgi:DNA modification methylase|nr:site-specific DNA-methyltransferase [Prevotella sp.]
MTENYINTIIEGDALEVLKTLPSNLVNCIVTSPPYYRQRDYGFKSQIGMEATPEKYINRLVEIFREAKRVLRNDGTLWVNIADSYANSGKGGANYPENAKKYKQGTNKGSLSCKTSIKSTKKYKPKDLIGIPWMLAFALRADGWYLRQDIIWSKPNPMPESVQDRCTKSHEYIFLLSKSRKYYFDADAIKTDAINPSDDIRRMNQVKDTHKRKPDNLMNGIRKRKPRPGIDTRSGNQGTGDIPSVLKANKRSVWTVATKPYKEAHFATFPEPLIVDCIKAGSPENGIVMDIFSGSGTTYVTARKLNRNAIAIEFKPAYIRISDKRIYNELGMFR